MPHSVQLVHLGGRPDRPATCCIDTSRRSFRNAELGSIVYFWRERAQTAAFQPLQLPRHRNADKFVFSAVWFRPKLGHPAVCSGADDVSRPKTQNDPPRLAPASDLAGDPCRSEH
jgi:hypothetical protein